MSERLAPIEIEEDTEGGSGESWATGEHYARMNIEAGNMGDAYYYSLPAFTILTKTQEDMETINDEFSVLISKYTDQIIVGTSHEASLILSLNQAAADLEMHLGVINTLREKVREFTGSYEAAGDWEENKG